jgi:hypothetical protein
MQKFLACSLLALAVACGGGSKPTTTTAKAEQPVQVTLPEGVPFDKLDHDQKIEFMKQKVVPALEPVFKNHDPKKYAEFGCATCHGKQAMQGHFDMPSTDTPKLNFKDMSPWKKEDLEWMGKEVKPAMAKVLGLTEYSPENPTGFGCGGCHVVEF